MRNSNLTPQQKARSYAFLLLKFRLRSEKELYTRLKNKKFDKEIVEQTIAFLKDKGFLDDTVFAKAWIESRLKKPFGLRRLSQELKAKGISGEIIEANIGEIKKGYCEEEVVEQLAKERLAKLKSIEPLKAKQRVYGFLLRRGFSPAAAAEVIRRL